MSRTRLLRPGFFADEELSTKLSRDSRLAYAGLWTECDDAGYFEAKPRQLARAIFGYDDDGLEVVETALRDLVALEKAELFDCGLHGLVPSLPRYAQQGGNKAYTLRDRHETDCLGVEHQRARRGPAPRADSLPTRSISVATRTAVIARDQDRCRYCGTSQADLATALILEHVDNLGPGTVDNVVQACRPCNVKKSRHGLGNGIELLPPPSEQVHTSSTDTAPLPVQTLPEQVHTSSSYPAGGNEGTNKSRSESVSVLESVTTKKNVLDEVVEETNEARDASAFEVDPDPFLSDPVRLGRPRASTMAPIRPPDRLESMTPKWRLPCTNYVAHASQHRLVDGQAICDLCEAAAAPKVPVNGSETPQTPPQKGLGL
jgi:5-methylcytosine-specific restriction endonuclease McrA